MGAVQKMQAAVLGRRMVEDSPSGFAGADPYQFLLANGVDWRGCQRLMALGVPGRFVATLGAQVAIGQARVCLSRDGARWDPVGPDARLLLACFDAGVMVDIAAVSTAHSDQVALRSGDGWCLGEHRIEDAERAAMAGRRVRLRVFDDALQWLRASGEGIVVLDWAAALPRLRGLGERVTLEASPEMALHLRAKMLRGGLPTVAGPLSDGDALSLAEKIGRAA